MSEEAAVTKKRSAGILLVRVVRGELIILLRRRAANDSWGGAFQVTSHGGYEPQDGEGYPQATVEREMVEELACARQFAARLVSRMRPLGQPIVTAEKEVRTFYAMTYDSDSADLGPMLRRLEVISINQVDMIKDIFDPLPDGTRPNKRSILPLAELRMFGDELAAVRELVRLFRVAQM
ncbi:NUDIX domain-containing protein [Candidatus Uhrbacteria bacterium]|nr:NUDIX domain-containing protein [Candidatus Uhrbacteria bacterium]